MMWSGSAVPVRVAAVADWVASSSMRVAAPVVDGVGGGADLFAAVGEAGQGVGGELVAPVRGASHGRCHPGTGVLQGAGGPADAVGGVGQGVTVRRQPSPPRTAGRVAL